MFMENPKIYNTRKNVNSKNHKNINYLNKTIFFYKNHFILV